LVTYNQTKNTGKEILVNKISVFSNKRLVGFFAVVTIAIGMVFYSHLSSVSEPVVTAPSPPQQSDAEPQFQAVRPIELLTLKLKQFDGARAHLTKLTEELEQIDRNRVLLEEEFTEKRERATAEELIRFAERLLQIEDEANQTYEEILRTFDEVETILKEIELIGNSIYPGKFYLVDPPKQIS